MRTRGNTLQRRLAWLATSSLLLLLVLFAFTHDAFFPVDGGGDISCHYSRLTTPDTEDLSPPPPRNSIFFHETSCKNGLGLTARQACAVESAALAHPHRQVYVLFLSPLAQTHSATLEVLSSYPNVHIARVLLERYVVGSPLEEWFATGALNASNYRTSHTSDVLRYLTLWKHGGVYLDLDVVVAKPLDDLVANWAGRESRINVAAGALSFSGDEDGRRYANAAIRELRSSFNGKIWGYNGPGVITRVLQRHCNTRHVHVMNAQRCGGFEVYPEEYFYPVSWQQWAHYFNPAFLPAVRNMTRTHIFHVWNKHSAKLRLRKDSRAPYTYLAAKYCPKVYGIVDDYF